MRQREYRRILSTSETAASSTARPDARPALNAVPQTHRPNTNETRPMD